MTWLISPRIAASPASLKSVRRVAPAPARKAAREALAVRKSVSPSNKGGTLVGVARARDLANGRNLSLDTVRRMVSFFSRHSVDKTGKTWATKGKGWQAWHLWGGDAGREWAEREVRKHEARARVKREKK